MSFTKTDLKYNVENIGSNFFSRDTMKFFGDTMANYGMYKDTVNGIAVYALYRKRPVKHGLQGITYFNAVTFERVRKTE